MSCCDVSYGLMNACSKKLPVVHTNVIVVILALMDELLHLVQQ